MTGGNISGNLTVAGVLTPTGGVVLSSSVLELSDGTSNIPAYSFASDPDTGIYRSGVNNLAISTNGIERINFKTATTDISNILRMDYQGGSNQLAFQLADLTYDLTMYTDTNEDFHITHGEFAKQIMLEFASSGEVVVQPNSAAVTNTGFCVNVGNGATYDTVFGVNATDIVSSETHKFANGLEATPSITFNNHTGNGLYSTSSTSWGLSVNGVNKMTLDAGNITLKNDMIIAKDLNPAITLDGDNGGTQHQGVITMKSSSSSDSALQFFNNSDVAFADGDDIFSFLNTSTTTVAEITHGGSILGSSNSVSLPTFSSTIDRDSGILIGSGLTSLIANANESLRVTATTTNCLNSTLVLEVVDILGAPSASVQGGLVFSVNENAVVYRDSTNWRRIDTGAIVSF